MVDKKCEPLRCPLFKSLYDKMWDKIAVDGFIVNCPHRKGLNCRDEELA